MREGSDGSGIQDRVKKSESPDHGDAPAIAYQGPEMNRARVVRRTVLPPFVSNEHGTPAKRYLVVEGGIDDGCGLKRVIQRLVARPVVVRVEYAGPWLNDQDTCPLP